MAEREQQASKFKQWIDLSRTLRAISANLHLSPSFPNLIARSSAAAKALGSSTLAITLSFGLSNGDASAAAPILLETILARTKAF
jgi:hypothetical protein